MAIPFIISIVLQVAFIVHVMKTGRNRMWIYILVFLSYVGMIAYLVVEVLPGLSQSRMARRASRSLRKVLNPQGDLRKYENEVRIGGNVASRQRYAEELTRQGRHDEAVAEYRQALTGLYEHDPNLMLSLARAHFEKGDAAATRAVLDDLIRLNPDFKSQEGHLLYARALEGEGNMAKALDEYKAISAYYSGAEASVRYAQLLNAEGRNDEAQRVAQDLLDGARMAPAHYRRAQRPWLDQAQRLAR